MQIYAFRTSAYARDVYLYGNRTFGGIPAEYHEPVKQYAANTYAPDQIQQALDRSYITQIEYDETLAYQPESPGTEGAL